MANRDNGFDYWQSRTELDKLERNINQKAVNLGLREPDPEPEPSVFIKTPTPGTLEYESWKHSFSYDDQQAIEALSELQKLGNQAVNHNA